MLGNKNVKHFDELDFWKRQTAADLLKRDTRIGKAETLEDKGDRLVAMLCGPETVLVEHLSKRGAPVGAANSAGLCKDTDSAADDEAKRQARRAGAIAELRAKLTYRDALGNTHEPGATSYEPGQIDHPRLFDLARELHNALIAGDDEGLNALLDSWISARMGYQDQPQQKTVADDPTTLRKKLEAKARITATRGEGRSALGASNAAGLLR